jgi:hypothetical protein
MECWSDEAVECSTPILQYCSRPARLHESLFLGVAGELDAGIDAELLIDVVEMHFDRSLADEEPLRNLAIPQPRGRLLDDLDLSGRQYLSGLLLSCLALEQFFQRAAHRALLQPQFARVHFADALHEKLRRQLLDHESAHAQMDRFG